MFNNLTATWNVTENLSFTSDISYFRESGWYPVSVFGSSFDALNALPNGFGFNASLFPQHPRGANAYGIAQYATYKVDDSIKLGARVEFWRDAKNFFAAAYPGYFDSVNSEHGFPCSIGNRAAAGTRDELSCDYRRRHFFAKADGASIFFRIDPETRISMGGRGE